MRYYAVVLMSCLFFLICNPNIWTQNYVQQHKGIAIFDPNGVSESFKSSFRQLSNHSIELIDTIDEQINNYDALFLFIEYPYSLSDDEGNHLIEYLNLNKPIYLTTTLFWQSIDSVAFWNHIGIIGYGEIPLEVHVNYLSGVDTLFTKNVLIDTNFICPSIPVIGEEVTPILNGIDTISIGLSTTFISTVEPLNVIVDLYRLIHHIKFLEKVLNQFGLNESPKIQFYPPVNTAWIAGGCVGPDIVAQSLVSTSVRDSITIGPGLNSFFFYYDSVGSQIFVDKYYFIAIDSLDLYAYELWLYPKSYPPFDPLPIVFDSTFYIEQNFFDIQLIVKVNNETIDSLSQFFRAEWGLDVNDNEFLPSEFSLSQNYPNPFNPTTNIKYSIGGFPPGIYPANIVPPQSEEYLVILIVYDIQGNVIKTLVNEEKSAGEYEVQFDGTGLPSGIYFYQLKAGNSIQTRKMILLK